MFVLLPCQLPYHGQNKPNWLTKWHVCVKYSDNVTLSDMQDAVRGSWCVGRGTRGALWDDVLFPRFLHIHPPDPEGKDNESDKEVWVVAVKAPEETYGHFKS